MSVVLVHGLGQTAECWNDTLNYIDKKNDFYCPDLYHLTGRKPVVYQNLYASFAEYCKSIDVEIKLCGLSLGAVLALNYAMDHPEKVGSLVLIAPQYKMPKALLRFQNLIFTFMPEIVFQGMEIGKEEFIQLSKSMMDIDFSKKLHTICCPVLLLCGERDAANRKAAVALHEILTDSSLEFIYRSSHEVNKENPEDLAKHLCSFFDLRYVSSLDDEKRTAIT